MAVVIGGRGSNRGVLVSAFTLIMVLEGSRFLVDWVPHLGSSELAAIRLILMGAAWSCCLSSSRTALEKNPAP
jgi:branched-chain amino acid transport system permease protein